MVLAGIIAILLVAQAEPDEKAAEKQRRLDVLTVREQNSVERFKRAILLGKGLGGVSTEDFLVAYDPENRLLVEDNISAAEKLDCGPLISYIAERLSLDRDDQISLLYYFHVTGRRNIFSQETYLKWLAERGVKGQTSDSKDGGGVDGVDTVYRIAILAEVMHSRSRKLNDSEIKFLRDTRWTKAALREYLKIGPKPAEEKPEKPGKTVPTVEEKLLVDQATAQWNAIAQLLERRQKILAITDAKESKAAAALARIDAETEAADSKLRKIVAARISLDKSEDEIYESLKPIFVGANYKAAAIAEWLKSHKP